MTEVNGISIFKDRFLSGPANNTNKIYFKGNIINASASGNISTITCSVNVSGNYGELVFIENNNFQTSQKLSFNPTVGILTTSSGIGVKDWFISKTSGVGIGLDHPTENLHVNGNALFSNIEYNKNFIYNNLDSNNITVASIKDYNNSPGTLDQVLTSTGVGVSWKSFIDPSGTWGGLTGVRTDNVTYTNTTGSLLYVSATPGIDRDAEGLLEEEVAGSYSIAEVGGIEVARARDNGTANSVNLFMNVDFFVPNGSDYIVKVYDSIGNQWISSITTYSWSEFEF